MRHKIISTFFILTLFAVGANARTGYESAREKVKIGGKNIIVKSQVYLNLMPGAISENEIEDCSKTGKLIAPVTLENTNGGRLPKQIEILRVWIKNNDSWRQISFNKDEINHKESSIYAVARACPNEKFKAEKEIIVVVELKYKGKSYFVRSKQTETEKVY
jgi:hypothetical protein